MRYILVFLLLLSLSTKAQNVMISACLPSYANREIRLYKEDNFITKDKDIIEKIKFNSKGEFKINFNTSRVDKIYFDADFFKIYLYVYPGFEASIIFPEYKEKPKGDIFFRPLELPAKIDYKRGELNSLILDFDKDLSQLNNKYYYELLDKKKGIIDSIKKSIEPKYISKNEYFNMYKKYSYAECEFPVYTENIKAFIAKYFTDGLVYNEAFNEIFSKSFDSFLSYEHISDTKAESIYSYQLKNLKSLGIVNNELALYVLINSLYKQAFMASANKETYLNVLNLISNKTENIIIKNTALKAIENITYLSAGYPCPIIDGLDMLDNKVITSSFVGKYLYILFFERFSSSLGEELNLLASIADKKDYLHVSIVCDEKNKMDNIELLRKYKLDDNAIFCKNYESIISKFKLIITPSYFLVDKDGNIMWAHTIRPDEKLLKTLNDINIKELRTGKQNIKTFFN